ncbi:MAG: transporter substrate-binding protein [Burkholderiales bacterium]|jgi:branched-chain amino acid transport system substrate-binding protein|nr:transporter substrate-binding protein [Burkholderiales bacterium]
MIRLLVAALLVTAAPAFAQDNIKIGLIVDRIGFAKAWSEPITQGAVYAARELNAKGGVLGRKIELLIEDDQSKPELSATAARKLEGAGVAFILSLTHTVAALQAQTVTVESKTPHLAPSLTVDTLTTQIDNPNFWQTGPLASTQIATLLAYARTKDYRNVALVSDNSAISQATAKAFKAEFDKAGLRLVADEVLPSGAQSADAQMQKVRAANADAIFLATLLTPENLLVLRYYRSLGIKTPLIGNYNFAVPVYSSVAKGLLDGLVFVDVWDPAKPQVKQFIASYAKEMGVEPHNMMGYGYDGVMMAADAIRRAGGTDKEKVRRAMQATRAFKGVLGGVDASYGFADGKRIGFDPQGMVVRMYEGDRQGRVLHVGTK